ncbi:MAG: GAF domain-containing protein [Chloroflexales bacterium]|nr:GAF domain-containing protein [Chloroflexales bacterium]
MTTNVHRATPPVELVPEDGMTVAELVAVLERRERIQRALAACSRCLIGGAASPADERQALAEALEQLRAGAGVLRVTLFENFTHPESGFSSRPIAEGYAPGEQPLGKRYGPAYHIPWSSVPTANYQALAAGEHIGGPVEQLFVGTPPLIAIERDLGIGAVQFFSIFVDGHWWGYIAFDDREAREWDVQEVLLIRTTAEIIGAFLQRNRAIATLREREAMLRAIGDNLPDAYIYQLEEHPDGSVRRTYMSRGLERRTGVSVEQTLVNGTRLPFELYSEDVPTYEARRDAARANVAPYEHEHRYVAVDGSVRWVRARASPRRLADGRTIWDGIVFDTTSYKLLQEELRQLNLGLSRRVDELTLLNRIAHLLGGMTSLRETLELVCQLLREAFSAAEVLVALSASSAGSLSIVARASEDGEAPEPQPGALDGVAARVTAQGGNVFLEERSHPGCVILTVALHAHDTAIGLLQIRVEQPGSQLTPDAVSLAQTIAGAIATAAANVQLYERAVRSSERLERLNAASRMINAAGLDLPTLYAAIHRAAAHLMPVEAFVISLVEAEERMVAHVYNYDRAGFLVAGRGRAPLEQSFAGFIRSHGPSLRVDDFLEFYEQHPEVEFSVFGDGEDTRSGLAASFLTADGLYGLLFAQCYPPGMYNDDDLIILELLAAHAATAIENARRAQQTRRDAVDEERNRLARELHDSVTQSLFSASLIAERLPAVARKSADEGRQGLELVQQFVRGALAEMRALLVELRPAALAAAPLHEAIGQLTQAFGGRRGIAITVNLDPAPPLPPAVQVALYRIVQESLSNVIKHARARSATVRMRVEPPARDHEEPWSGTITIHVHDDGRGFQPAQAGAGSFGIGIMRERAATIGARLELASQPGHGTWVELIWRGVLAQEDGA